MKNDKSVFKASVKQNLKRFEDGLMKALKGLMAVYLGDLKTM